MFSLPSFAEWTKITVGGEGTTFYLSKNSIRTEGEYIKWWVLKDRLKPTARGTYSAKTHQQGECSSFRYRTLSWVFHPEKMGGGIGNMRRVRNPKWIYPKPNTIDGYFLKIVCAYKNSR